MGLAESGGSQRPRHAKKLNVHLCDGFGFFETFQVFVVNFYRMRYMFTTELKNVVSKNGYKILLITILVTAE